MSELFGLLGFLAFLGMFFCMGRWYGLNEAQEILLGLQEEADAQKEIKR